MRQQLPDKIRAPASLTEIVIIAHDNNKESPPESRNTLGILCIDVHSMFKQYVRCFCVPRQDAMDERRPSMPIFRVPLRTMLQHGFHQVRFVREQAEKCSAVVIYVRATS